ncbi:MAG: hypothetical protein RBU37_20695 [Myxococcota bacterium]|jgi:hypothetical protein|nr:hypothetical protein [Myxococcota bacterium]
MSQAISHTQHCLGKVARVSLVATFLILLMPNLAWSQSREQALQALHESSVDTQAAALRQLTELAVSGDEKQLAPLLDDQRLHPLVCEVLAAIDSEASRTLLREELASSAATRREAAAIAMIRYAAALSEDELASLRLQLGSDAGRRWLVGREQFEAAQVLLQAVDELLLQVDGLEKQFNPDCIQQQSELLGISIERLRVARQRIEEQWKSGNLEALASELEGLETAARASLELEQRSQNCSGAVTTPPDPNPRPHAEFWSKRSRQEQLILRVDGYLGHDNHTFLMRPGLSVSEAGPFFDDPIDLRRDDTLYGGLAELFWYHPLNTNQRSSWEDRGLRHRGNSVFLSARAGYHARLRWGQMMGPEFGLRAIYDDDLRLDDDLPARLRLELDADFAPSRIREQLELLVPPLNGLRVDALVSYAEASKLPNKHTDFVPRSLLELFSQTRLAFFDQGISEYESWSTAAQLRAAHLFDLAKDIFWGGQATVNARVGDGLGNAATASLAFQIGANTDKRVWMSAALGYSGGLSFAAPEERWIGTQRFATKDGWGHTPFAEAKLHFGASEDDMQAALELLLSHGLRASGRYAPLLEATEARFSVTLNDQLDLYRFQLDLFGLHGRGTPGEQLLEQNLTPVEQVEVALLGLSFVLPLGWDDELINVNLVGDGRLVSDSSRFNGELQGEFAISLLVQFFGELM